MLEVRDIWHKDLDTNRRTLPKKAKIQATEHKSVERLEHARGLQHQRQLIRATEDKAASTWTSAVLQLPREVLSFSLNVAQGTLPHNANLALWRKKDGLSDVCKLCRMRQILSHVLNQCHVPPHLRRYNTRCDAVLEVIKSIIMPIADFHSHQPYIFPPTPPTPISTPT